MLEGLEAPRGEVDAARRHAGGRGGARPVPQVHQLVGDLGAPAGDVERGERVRRLQQRGAQRAVRLAHVGQLAALGGREPSR